MRTYGLEIEKVVSNEQTSQPHGMSQEVFKTLGQAAVARGQTPHDHESDTRPGTLLGVVTKDFGEQGIDNGFNLQETSLPPTTDLNHLAALATSDMSLIRGALQKEGATFLNMALHPLGSTGKDAYEAFVAPKSLYPYLWLRGWDHTAGIDGKAQNSPSTGVSAYEAADATSVVIGVGAALVGIFGNSPYAEGKATGVKEYRLTIWDRMMKNSTVEGDRTTVQYPPERFRTLAQYFNWMFGGDTGIHFVLADGHYKSLGDQITVVEGNPSVLRFLAQPTWKARYLKDVLNNDHSNPVTVEPKAAHMEAMQFAQFTGARVRYLLADNFPVAEFLAACKRQSSTDVEAIFDRYARNMYIEGRDAGSNFPDLEIQHAGADIARSVVVAPSAIQAGLIGNLTEAVALLDEYGWQRLGALRQAAIKDGLAGEVDGLSVKKFASEVLDIAARGLKPDEQWMLAYPQWVLKTGENGADRAIQYVQSRGGGKQAIADLVKFREVVL